MGLRGRLILLVLLVTVPALLLALYTNLEQRRLRVVNVENDAKEAAHLVAANQNGLIEATRQHLNGLSHFPQAARGHDLAAFDVFFAGMRSVYADYTDFGLIETNGDLVSRSSGRRGQTNLAAEPYFQRALNTRDLAVGDYQPGQGTNIPSLPFGYPVFDDHGQLVRVLFAAINLSVINSTLAKAKVPEGSVIEVFDRSGHLLARNLEPERWVGKPFVNSSVFTTITSHVGGTVQMRGIDDTPRLHAFTAIRKGQDASLFISVGIPTREAYAEAQRSLVRDLCILCAVASLALLVARVYADRYILSPVEALTWTAARIGSGQLEARVEIPHASGELHQLGQAFDNMAASLQQQRSEAERTGQALRQSERRFRQLAEAMPQIVWTARADGHTDYYNQRWYECTGLPKETCGDAAWKAVLHPEDVDACLRQWYEHVESGLEFQIQYRLKDQRTASFRWHLGRALPVRDDTGKIVRWFGTCTDIDDQKQSEAEVRRLNTSLENRVLERTAQLETANKELEAFAYSVSHDLRAPLRHIGAYVDILRQESGPALNENGQRCLGVISGGARRMGILIDELLGFSRMSTSELRRGEIQMQEIVREVVQEMESDTRGRDIRWRIELLPRVSADRTMLKQVWANLVSNAVKYTRHKRPAEIQIGCRKRELEYEFYVRDNGAGFDMHYASKLFGVFQRLHHADEFEGTGIGLANARRIVSRHGGRIWAEGKVNEGAIFYFTLPCAVTE